MERSWKYRRLMAFLIVIGCLGLLFGGLIIGGDSLVVQSVIQAASLALMSTSGAYLAVAAWDDRNKGQEQLQMNKEKGIE